MCTYAACGKKSNRTRKTRVTSKPCAARATASRLQREKLPSEQLQSEKLQSEYALRNRIFFKLLAAFLVVIVAAAVTFDIIVGGAWLASLRPDFERKRTQKGHLPAHVVETDPTHRFR